MCSFIDEWIEEGVAIGLEQGRELMRQRQIVIAKKLLSSGMSISMVADMTELSVSEITCNCANA
jgi:predicted transposase/invertase (TIGR01784 family)